MTRWQALVPYKWLYQLLVVLTIAASIYGIKALVDLVKNRPAAFKEALMGAGRLPGIGGGPGGGFAATARQVDAQ